jgi:hypothetical protein
MSLSTSSHAQTSVSEGFAGWCYFDQSDGPLQITLQGYATSEGGCGFSNPTQIRGMDALLFDTTCSGDGFVLPDFRTMIATIGSEAFQISGNSFEKLNSCNAPLQQSLFSNGNPSDQIEASSATADINYLKNNLDLFDLGTVAAVAIGRSSNFSDNFLAFTLGGCGTGCGIPLVIDTLNGEILRFPNPNEEQAELQLFADPTGPHVNLIFLSYRDDQRVCVSQLHKLVGREIVLLSESTYLDEETLCGRF